MTARLHHEQIARSDSSPARWLALTHGIYGAGSNWRGIARKLTERRPDWGVVLVDLRQHGRSDAGAPPHTVAAAAEDVCALVATLPGVVALAGHSFGGKVMLAARAQLPAGRLVQTWLLDSNPAARPGELARPDNSVGRVLELIARLPKVWARREDFIAAVVADGHDAGLAAWLGMNIVPDATGALVQRLDPEALRALLTSYFATDLWASANEPARGALEIVVADQAHVFEAADAPLLADAPPHVHVHHVDAGHWLHIEAPAVVVELLAAHLP